MGNMIAGHMDGVMKKNTETMKEQQIVMLERQMAMNNYIRERQAAMQLSRAREMFNWWLSFYALASLGMVAGFMKRKNPATIAPLIPLTFIVGYQADLSYGGKLNRIRADAEKILTDEMGLLAMPTGMPTVEQLDELRKNKKK